jgi:septal ring factor EnvC (AmiA/AmiB activator)
MAFIKTERGRMDQDKHVEHLNDFRAAIVDERRRLAKALSAKKSRTEKARKDFIETQETIEAIDRALADERDVASRSKSPATDDT